METEGKSQESISKVPFMSSDKIASQVDSTGLGWKIISSDTRVKSCEEIPAEHYKPTYGVSSLEDDASLRNRTKSEPSLAESKTKSPQAVVELHERRNTFDNPVQTVQSKHMNRVSSTVGGGFFPWVKIISPMESRNRFVGSEETRFQNLPKHN